VSTRSIEPLTPFVPEDPDADWERVRARVMARLAEQVPDTWSDHNAVDPGVTLAESAAYGLADLHYRIAERPFDAWPLEVRDWEPDASRHWHATLPAGSLTGIAAALAAPGTTSAAVLEPLVRDSASRADATALLSQAPWAGVFSAAQRPVVISLMRQRRVRQVAQEHADLVSDAVETETRAAEATLAAGLVPDPVPVRDARAAVELGFSLPLWAEELTAVVRRERRRLAQEALVARLAEVRAATTATAPATRAALAADHLDPTEVDIAMAAAEQPPGLVPEDLEDDGGRSRVWPPHPIQALTCEPVVALDYARRARAHPQVGRAWAVDGRLEGIAWNGLPTGTAAEIAVDGDAAAVTLIVERVSGTGTAANFLRSVLATAIGPEVADPFPDWRDDVDDLEPRRVICDEVGATLLAVAPVLVQATLVTAVGVDRDAVIDDVRNRISAFFTDGRPETRAPDVVPTVDGPWPRFEQPPRGWIPGEPIRFTEVVDAMVANPEVWGVEQLSMKIQGDPAFVPQSAGSLALPRNASPVLADARCLRVRFSLTSECGDA